ncbi:hypothetical protein ACP0HM_23530 [Escherichia coli]
MEQHFAAEAAHRINFDIGGGGWHDDRAFTPNRAEENATPCAWLPAEAGDHAVRFFVLPSGPPSWRMHRAA